LRLCCARFFRDPSENREPRFYSTYDSAKKRPLLLLCSIIIVGAPLTRAAETAVAAPTVPATPTASSTTLPSDQNYSPRLNYQVYFGDYLALKKGQPVDLIFIGDSITEQWRWGAGWPVWKQHFEARALDFGLGSDRTQHTIWRLQNIDLSSFTPKVALAWLGCGRERERVEAHPLAHARGHVGDEESRKDLASKWFE
jgi:hypothetical protein